MSLCSSQNHDSLSRLFIIFLIDEKVTYTPFNSSIKPAARRSTKLASQLHHGEKVTADWIILYVVCFYKTKVL